MEEFQQWGLTTPWPLSLNILLVLTNKKNNIWDAEIFFLLIGCTCAKFRVFSFWIWTTRRKNCITP